MSRFIAFLERKLGRYAIPRLPMIMLICYAVGYVIQMVKPEAIYLLSLNPYAILHGQIWRLFTWVLLPPNTSNLFFTVIMLYFYYSIGTTLERTWGSFYFNYYIFSGMVFTILGAFCMLGFNQLTHSPEELAYLELAYSSAFAGAGISDVNWLGGSFFYAGLSSYFSTYYINMSIFLAFAATYPDMQVLLMFIIPIKVKVLAIVYAVVLILEGFNMGVMGLFVIGASLLNFVIFFLSTRKGKFRTPGQIHRQRTFAKKMQAAGEAAKRVAKHKCAICGRTSDEYPDLEFRFCSKCEGNYEFCAEHLFTHRHFKRSEP